MSVIRTISIIIITLCMQFSQLAFASGNGIVVFQSDFGLSDQAVSAMHGVALGVDKQLKVEDLTHAIAAYNICFADKSNIQAGGEWRIEIAVR